jgi:hypothetical protein
MAKEVLCLKRQLFSLVICLILVCSSFTFSINTVTAPSGDGIVEVDVPPRGTFLHAIDGFPYDGAGDKVPDETLGLNIIIGSYYNVEDPAIVDLHTEGFTEGDKIIITYTAKLYYDGTYHPTNPDAAGWPVKDETELFWGGLLGVFSTTSNLKDIKEADRVPDAVDSDISEILTPTTKWSEHLQEISDKLSAHGEAWYTGPEYTDISYDFKITNPHQGFEMTIPRNARFLFLCCIDDLYYDNLGEIKVIIEKDTDEDGIPDNWEKNGLDINKDGIIDLDLPMLGADWEHKDIFVEVDGMTDWPPSFWDTKQAFANSPVTNPDGVNGVNLHIISDEKIPVLDPFRIWVDFERYKNQFFGSVDDTDETVDAKKLVFRYCIIVTGTLSLWNGTHYEQKSKTGGVGEMPGDDFVVKIESDTSNNDLNGIFMHELGHTLGLDHGGPMNTAGAEINYKPNYLSVMNYLFDMTNEVADRPLDYSRKSNILDEQNLDEAMGIGAINTWRTVWRGPPPENELYISRRGQVAIDWNGDGNFTSGVKVNLNNYPEWNYNSPDNEVLRGYNDWPNLIYRFRGYPGSFSPSVHEEVAIEEDYWAIVQKETEAAQFIQESTEASPEVNVRTFSLKEGDWIEYSAWYTGAPPDTLSSRFKIRMGEIVGTQITVSAEGQNLDGEDWSISETYDLKTGFHDLLLIPAGLDVGDQFYHEEFGNIVIQGVEKNRYAGEERTVVWSTFSGHTLHWDQDTGVLCQAYWNWSSDYETHWTLEKTSLWAQMGIGWILNFLSQIGLDPTLLVVLLIAVVGIIIILVYIKRKKQKQKFDDASKI